MAINFTELGFEEGVDALLIVPVAGTNASVSGNVDFTDRGVYADTASDGTYGTARVFFPWSNIRYISQNL